MRPSGRDAALTDATPARLRNAGESVESPVTVEPSDAAHDTLIVCAGSHTANARENAPCWTRVAAAVAVPAFAAYRRRHASHVAQSNTPDRDPP